jgi:hemerythrin-like domain-containing protein
MPLRIGEKRQADFGDPLGMLSDCHRRIESFLEVLLALASERKGELLDAGERASLKNALEYFRHSGPRHTADEEESLFPRMKQCEAGAAALRSLEALHQDHLAADRAHAEIDALGARWLSDGRPSAAEAARLAELLESLSKLYARHIDIEDHEIFPTAGRVLTPEHIASIGEEMARRRKISRS